MNKLAMLLMGLLLASFNLASANTGISQSQIDIITAECNQEASGAVDEKIYIENCIEDNIQALKEQSGQGEKEPS